MNMGRRSVSRVVVVVGIVVVVWIVVGVVAWAEDGFQSWCGQNIGNMVNQQVKVGAARNDKRAKRWCGTGKVGVATVTPAIRHSSPMGSGRVVVVVGVVVGVVVWVVVWVVVGVVVWVVVGVVVG